MKDYEKLWYKFKSYLQDVEANGGMLQQTMAQAYLDLMQKLESESELQRMTPAQEHAYKKEKV